jgi:hypothetical protein
MLAIAKPTWIDGLVKPLRIGCLIAVLALCASTLPAPTTGMVGGVLGVQLASRPGGPPSRELESNFALLLGSREIDGSVWSHLLGADGTHGWTAKALGQPQPTTAVPASPALSIFSKSPDDPDFDSASEIPLEKGAVANIIGGSTKSRPPSVRSLMIPERLNRSIAPWLELKVGASSGFAPAEWLSLRWPVENAATGNLADRLRQSGFTGITRKPFLDPIAEVLKKAAPTPGTTLQHCESADDPLDRRVSSSKWDQPLATILAGDKGSQGLVVEFADAESVLFTFVGNAGNESHVWIEQGRPYVLRAQLVDLENDGTPEWLLEVVGTYGDGYYSMLWVVKQSASDLQIDRLALSHSSGEVPGPPTDAAWWVDSDRKLWIIAAGAETTAQSFSYKHGLVSSPVKRTTKGLVVLSEHPDYDSGMASRLKMSDVANAPGLFPIRSAGTVHWVVARPFEQVTEAREWASKHSLPAASVLAVPAPKK